MSLLICWCCVSGDLRPARQSAKRSVPAHIGRPDYADDGFPESEQKLRGSTSIKVLSDEEIEGMRVACKVSGEYTCVCRYCQHDWVIMQ